jgi:hypothetical protein
MISITTRAKEGQRTYKDIDHEKEMRDSFREMPMPKRRESYSAGLLETRRKHAYFCKYQSWSPHCVMILSESSRKVTIIRKRPIAGRWGLRG